MISKSLCSETDKKSAPKIDFDRLRKYFFLVVIRCWIGLPAPLRLSGLLVCLEVAAKPHHRELLVT